MIAELVEGLVLAATRELAERRRISGKLVHLIVLPEEVAALKVLRRAGFFIVLGPFGTRR